MEFRIFSVHCRPKTMFYRYLCKERDQGKDEQELIN